MTAEVRAARRRRWWRRPTLWALVVVLALVAAAVGWAWNGASGYYTYEPGNALPVTASTGCVTSGGNPHLPGGGLCARLVVPADRVHPVAGKLLMVDVLVGQTTPWQYALARLGLLDTFQRAAELHSARDVLGGAPAGQFTCQGVQEMDQATTDAPVAALRRLGYSVKATYRGSQVFLVEAGSPALKGGVRCGDLIVAVDGRPTLTAAALVHAVESHAPGTVVTVTVHRPGSGGRPVTRRVQVRLGSRPGDPKAGFLGIATQDLPTYKLPFHVGIDVGDIGGPSAGLALTLGLLDALSSGHLTGGHTVAVTGTIASDGAVGPVGGVAQKTVAVERAGATLFLVPAAEVATARREARPGLKVEGVTSLAQALDDLRAIGGTIPRT